MTVTLTQVAGWNPELRNPYRTRYATLGGRFFKVAAQNLADFWWLDEIDADGNTVDNGRCGLVAMCPNLPAVRKAITDLVAGVPAEQVYQDALKAPRAGTGRNAPANVARRKGRA